MQDRGRNLSIRKKKKSISLICKVRCDQLIEWFPQSLVGGGRFVVFNHHI